jgi:hypothetical protein
MGGVDLISDRLPFGPALVRHSYDAVIRVYDAAGN